MYVAKITHDEFDPNGEMIDKRDMQINQTESRFHHKSRHHHKRKHKHLKSVFSVGNVALPISMEIKTGQHKTIEMCQEKVHFLSEEQIQSQEWWLDPPQ